MKIIKNRHGKVNQEKFDLIKRLISAHVKISEVARAMQVHTATIYRISKADSMEQYLQQSRDAFRKYNPIKTEAKPLFVGSPNVSPKTKKSEEIETPIYDVLNRIEQQLITLNENFCKAGKSKNFRLW
jgi:hypothetical protein